MAIISLVWLVYCQPVQTCERFSRVIASSCLTVSMSSVNSPADEHSDCDRHAMP